MCVCVCFLVYLDHDLLRFAVCLRASFERKFTRHPALSPPLLRKITHNIVCLTKPSRSKMMKSLPRPLMTMLTPLPSMAAQRQHWFRKKMKQQQERCLS